VRLIGILSGIQAIAASASYLCQLGRKNIGLVPGRDGHRQNPMGGVLALVFGAALWPIGMVGTWFALLVKLAVNRQREFLADACAVQFTRDSQGLCDALKIIGGYASGSQSIATTLASLRAAKAAGVRTIMFTSDNSTSILR
jgi:Zn-dependent protease with chaperone function